VLVVVVVIVVVDGVVVGEGAEVLVVAFNSVERATVDFEIVDDSGDLFVSDKVEAVVKVDVATGSDDFFVSFDVVSVVIVVVDVLGGGERSVVSTAEYVPVVDGTVDNSANLLEPDEEDVKVEVT
jgi:hypothetical protein